MQDEVIATPTPHKRVPWNKGKLTGAKPPLRPKHVWSIRTKLQIEGRVRDLAMFNLAIDSKLRGCDVVAIRVEDVAAGGYTADRATVRQKKTGRVPVHGSSWSPTQYDDPPVCSPCFRVDRKRWTGPETVWDAFVATHKSDPDLSADRKSQGRSASACAYQDRKHGQIPGHRSR